MGEFLTLAGELSENHGEFLTLAGELSENHGEFLTLAGEISENHGELLGEFMYMELVQGLLHSIGVKASTH